MGSTLNKEYARRLLDLEATEILVWPLVTDLVWRKKCSSVLRSVSVLERGEIKQLQEGVGELQNNEPGEV